LEIMTLERKPWRRNLWRTSDDLDDLEACVLQSVSVQGTA
jgi:hypothetical protein